MTKLQEDEYLEFRNLLIDLFKDKNLLPIDLLAFSSSLCVEFYKDLNIEKETFLNIISEAWELDNENK